MTSLAVNHTLQAQPLTLASSQSNQLAELSVIANTPVVIVPGLNNSDESHWQSIWQSQLPNSRRIFVHEWSKPDLEKWRQGILKALRGLPSPALLIGHSFGALAATSIARDFPELVAGVFLVAPADPDKFRIASRLPQDILPVPGVVIASDNDPWMKDSKAAFWSLVWGANFLRIKGLGHINSESAIGYWPEGINQLTTLVRRIRKERN
jgi:predicted alpha/beta hydrolase family esterase